MPGDGSWASQFKQREAESGRLFDRQIKKGPQSPAQLRGGKAAGLWGTVARSHGSPPPIHPGLSGDRVRPVQLVSLAAQTQALRPAQLRAARILLRKPRLSPV